MAGKWFAALSIAIVGFSSCARHQSMIVLMPDADGRVGSATVTNEGGSSSLTEAKQVVRVAKASKQPKRAKPIDDPTISDEFGRALEAEPQKPEVFIVYFELNSDKLDERALEEMKQIPEVIRSRNSLDTGVHGHTDRSGDAAYNEALSLRRANRVRDLLVAAGIDPATLTVEYHGEGDPLIPTSDGVVEPRNRRVEVVVR